MLEGHDITELFENRDKNKLEVFDLKSPADIGKQNNLYWWNDPAFVIGVITTQERHVCITNTMEGMYILALFFIVLKPNNNEL